MPRRLGHHRVSQLIQARRLTPQGRIIGLQPKLTVGAADDQYEQEADRVARQVMTMPMPMPDAGSNSMQRAAALQSVTIQGCANFSYVEKSMILKAKAVATGNSDGSQFTNSSRVARNIVAMMCDKKGKDMANRQTTIT